MKIFEKNALSIRFQAIEHNFVFFFSILVFSCRLKKKTDDFVMIHQRELALIQRLVDVEAFKIRE